MLSLSNVGTGKVAVVYYEVDDDYYTHDCSPSCWWGEGAALLGLVGKVDPAVFADLLDGKIPDGTLLHNAGEGRRGGTDATFSAPKSVSLQAMVGNDRRLITAHQRSVDRALTHMETLAACRVTENRTTLTQQTGNLIVAKFEHDLSRACDPQLHTHCVLINATQRQEGQWRAMDNETIYRNKILLGALYRSELARECQLLGYEVRVTSLDGRFELAHMHEHQIKSFSQRSAAIEKFLKNQGQQRSEAGTWTKKMAAVKTRENKFNVDRKQLWQEWATLSHEKSIDYTIPQTFAFTAVSSLEGIEEVIKSAVTHIAERESVFTRTNLLGIALARGVGVSTLAELETVIDQYTVGGELIKNGDRFTTLTAQRHETEILSIEVAGRNTLTPIFADVRSQLLTRLSELKTEQQHAAMGILMTGHQVMGLQGRAGVGKTTLLEKITTIAHSCGYKVQGLAPSANAARELAATGMPAETLATFSYNEVIKASLKKPFWSLMNLE